jgi:hypothetical protein
MGLAEVRVAQSDGWPLGAFVQGVLPEAVSAAVLVCAEDNKPNAKLTVQLRNEKGEILGYLKYAEKRVACRRLDQEYSVLSTLQKGLGPEVLKYGTLGNGTALLVTPILGRVLLSPLPPPEGVAAYLMSLVLSSPVPLEAHPWVQSIRERSSNVAQLDAWFDVLANRRWPVVVQHGDFAPWNLLRSPRGEIKAFDWEYGVMKGFPYLDFAYYALQTSQLIYRLAPAKGTERAVRYLTNEPRFALSSTEALALVRLAAYDAYHRYLEDGMAPDEGPQPFRRAVWESKASSLEGIA